MARLAFKNSGTKLGKTFVENRTKSLFLMLRMCNFFFCKLQWRINNYWSWIRIANIFFFGEARLQLNSSTKIWLKWKHQNHDLEILHWSVGKVFFTDVTRMINPLRFGWKALLRKFSFRSVQLFCPQVKASSFTLISLWSYNLFRFRIF